MIVTVTIYTTTELYSYKILFRQYTENLHMSPYSHGMIIPWSLIIKFILFQKFSVFKIYRNKKELEYKRNKIVLN